MDITALAELDKSLFHALNGFMASPVMDQLMELTSNRWTWGLLGAAAVAFALFRRRVRLVSLCVMIALTCAVVDSVTYQILKPAFARERPCHQLQDVRLVQDRCGGDFGFPSNHAANGMAVTVVVGLTIRRRRPILIGLIGTFLTGFSRVYLGVHFPGDVLAGFIVGGLLGWACYAGYSRTVTRWLPLTAPL